MEGLSVPRQVPFSEALLRLRQRVMWPDRELDYSRVEGDEEALHYAISQEPQAPNDEARLISIVSVWLSEGEGGRSEAQFRKFATETSWQRKGLGTRLLQHVLSRLRQDQGVERVWCNARTEQIEFYGRFGMTVIPNSEFERGGRPYVLMEVFLKSAP